MRHIKSVWRENAILRGEYRPNRKKALEEAMGRELKGLALILLALSLFYV